MKFKLQFKPRKFCLKDIGRQEKNEKQNKKRLFMLTVILAIIVFFSGISLGKSIHNTILQNHVEIAKPILEVEKDSEIVITEDNKTGEYTFKVKNYNTAEEISQVDLQYYIEILGEDIDQSVTYELYKENEKMELEGNKTTEVKLNKDTKEEHHYKFKVKYNSEKNTVGDIIKNIQIKVHSEQLKI